MMTLGQSAVVGGMAIASVLGTSLVLGHWFVTYRPPPARRRRIGARR